MIHVSVKYFSYIAIVLVEANFSASNPLASHFIDLWSLTWHPHSELVDFLSTLPFLTSFDLWRHNTGRAGKRGHWWTFLSFLYCSLPQYLCISPPAGICFPALKFGENMPLIIFFWLRENSSVDCIFYDKVDRGCRGHTFILAVPSNLIVQTALWRNDTDYECNAPSLSANFISQGKQSGELNTAVKMELGET